MSKQRIENPTIDQVQVGDWVEGTYESHEFAGRVWEVVDTLRVGGTVIRWATGRSEDEVELTLLIRDVPDLPTKPGTVGRATVRGVPDVRIMLLAEESWTSVVRVETSIEHYEQHIDASTFVLELEGSSDE